MKRGIHYKLEEKTTAVNSLNPCFNNCFSSEEAKCITLVQTQKHNKFFNMKRILTLLTAILFLAPVTLLAQSYDDVYDTPTGDEETYEQKIRRNNSDQTYNDQ